MAWQELSFAVDATTAPVLEAALEALGALAITTQSADEQALFEPPPGTHPAWVHNQLTALFEAGTDLDLVELALRREPALVGLAPAARRHIAAADWQAQIQSGLQPLRYGRRLAVCPTHREPPADAVTVWLDPGLAFGTGTHPTTRLCLTWLDALGAEGALRGARVLDYGCGSGVLGLAALALGAATVHAVDIDPQAVRATQANAALNQREGQLTASLPASAPDGDFDLVLANILLNPLRALAPALLARLRPGGRVGLSGITTAQVEALGKSYAALQLAPAQLDEGWALLTGTAAAGT
ncbi:MAG: 50S ribosomal protein L11 methyltransferase [Pseudomonadota bacterium]|nr:50S ribosomal protein L11 methyltransferase [Pseudomonadota bacterium]HJO36943.1 50S ribosomal protein L11 methyltransferase [Gammaproteobacteria bacterium]